VDETAEARDVSEGLPGFDGRPFEDVGEVEAVPADL
jgi:hypothetical protein